MLLGPSDSKPLEEHHCLLSVMTPVSSKRGHKTKTTCSKRVPNIIVSPLLFLQVVALFAFFKLSQHNAMYKVNKQRETLQNKRYKTTYNWYTGYCNY